jgi:hypothetical protein
MKVTITKSKLRQIVKEEVSNILKEGFFGPKKAPVVDAEHIERLEDELVQLYVLALKTNWQHPIVWIEDSINAKKTYDDIKRRIKPMPGSKLSPNWREIKFGEMEQRAAARARKLVPEPQRPADPPPRVLKWPRPQGPRPDPGFPDSKR